MMNNQIDYFIFVHSDFGCLFLQIQNHLANVHYSLKERVDVDRIVDVFKERLYCPLTTSVLTQ